MLIHNKKLAVVMNLFPDIFFEYLIFTLPLWTLIYLWGVPRLLMADTEKKQTFKESLKSFINPMFIAMIQCKCFVFKIFHFQRFGECLNKIQEDIKAKKNIGCGIKQC